MTTTNVIILCQGSQSRLPALTCAKQLLPLAACNDVPILMRTLDQISRIAAKAAHVNVQIVAWQPTIEMMFMGPWKPRSASADVSPPNEQHPAMSLGFLTLPDPGNSSLKGIAAALSRQRASYEMTVVLLGDVVYSWAALRAMLLGGGGAHFFGTRDLSPSGGELFGVRWRDEQALSLMSQLTSALERHPKFTTYQPGQMRAWMTGGKPWPWDGTPAGWSAYHVVDDYTDDVDVPADVANLPELSKLAAADDAANGVIW